MSIKDVLVYIDHDAGCDNRVTTAAYISSAFEAHLAGLYVLHRMPIRIAIREPSHPQQDQLPHKGK